MHRLCQNIVDEACLLIKSTEVCVNELIERLLAAAAKESEKQSKAQAVAVAVPVAVAGEVMLHFQAACCLLLLLHSSCSDMLPAHLRYLVSTALCPLHAIAAAVHTAGTTASGQTAEFACSCMGCVLQGH
jgi:hypothetical protein